MFDILAINIGCVEASDNRCNRLDFVLNHNIDWLKECSGYRMRVVYLKNCVICTLLMELFGVDNKLVNKIHFKPTCTSSVRRRQAQEEPSYHAGSRLSYSIKEALGLRKGG